MTIGSRDGRRTIEGHATVAAILDRYLPYPGLTWEHPSIERATAEATQRIRRARNRIREPVSLRADGVIVGGADVVAAAHNLGLAVVPAIWLTTHHDIKEPDAEWVLFEHRLEWDEVRAVCHCGYAYPAKEARAERTLHPQHLAEVMFVAGVLAPVLDVVKKATSVIKKHLAEHPAGTHILNVYRCTCGAELDEDLPAVWVKHRADALAEAGLLLNPNLRWLLR